MNRKLAILCLAVFPLSMVVQSTGTAQDETKQEVAARTVPVFTFNGAILESPVVQDPFFGSLGAEPLKDLVARLEQARDDDEVAAVVLLLGSPSLGFGQLEEINRAVREIKLAGKPVYAHADSLSFGKLALASAASRISVTPVGDLFITGLYGSQPHLRGLLDKIHVTPDFITCGDYKSAAEMYMRSGPSPEAERMYDWLFDSIFDSNVSLIAQGRGKSAEAVRSWIDRGLYSAENAAELGIIDAAEYRSDFLAHIKQQHGDDIVFKKKYGKKKSDTLDLSSPFAMFKIWSELLGGATEPKRKTSVAIVYVEGPIMPGAAQPSPFGTQGIAYSDPIRKALDKAAEDDSVKAVVLRVNSPGGSAVASEIILQATRRLKDKKPLVVSMGDVAGSGGYYVSCAADTIFADASTITASIGVVAGKLATNEMWESVGINWHPIERGENSGMLFSGETFTDDQRQNLQDWMDEVYEVFQGHVVKIRGDRLTKPMEEIAGGRVFSGRQALELGLIDRIGTLSDAIKFAAKQANVEEYEVRVIPRPKNIIELMLSDLKGGEDDQQLQLSLIPQQMWRTQSLWDAAAPVFSRLEPHKAASIRRAFVQLEILQRERLALSMPEVIVGN